MIVSFAWFIADEIGGSAGAARWRSLLVCSTPQLPSSYPMASHDAGCVRGVEHLPCTLANGIGASGQIPLRGTALVGSLTQFVTAFRTQRGISRNLSWHLRTSNSNNPLVILTFGSGS